MGGLEGVRTEDLHGLLDEADDKRQTMRVVAAIAYTNGVTQTELARWFDVERKTIYNWLTRFESRPIDRAIEDQPRTGRRAKLTDDQRERLVRTLHESPEGFGYDLATWSPELVQHHLRAEYDVEYSLSSCRRLMREAGLTYRRGAPTDTEAGEWVATS